MLLPKACLTLTLLGLSAFEAFAQPSTSQTTKVLPVCASSKKGLETTAEVPKLRGLCYVPEIKAAKLEAQITSLSQALSADGDHHQSDDQIKTSVGEAEGLKTICSNSRINQIAEDLGEIATQLWSLANRVRNVSDTEVQGLDEEAVDLIQRLREIQVFSGNYLTPDAILLSSFEVQVDHLEKNLNSTLTLLKLQRPARPPIKFRPRPPTIKPKAKAEVSNDPIIAMYAGILSNFDRTLEFIQGKSSLEQQILGYVALYKEMEKHSHLETFELTKLAAQVQRAKDQQLSSSISGEIESKLTQLTVDIGPVMEFFRGNSTCRFTNVALPRDLVTTDPGYPEYGVLIDPPHRLFVQPFNGGPLVRIFGSYVYYASETSTYDSSRRHVLKPNGQISRALVSAPPTGFVEWKLVPVNGGQHFKVLNARYNEVMFVDSSLTHSNYRRVFLKRHDYSGAVAMPVNGDLWSINCSS